MSGVFSDRKAKDKGGDKASAPDPLSVVGMTRDEMEQAAKPPKAPEPPAEQEKAPAPPAASTPKPEIVRVRVKKTGQLYIHGAMVEFRVGSIVDANHYLPLDFRLICENIETEPAE